MSNESRCTVAHAASGPSNLDWWSKGLRLDLLNQHSARSNPLGNFNHRAQFAKLDYAALMNLDRFDLK